ncbi:MAG: hypothetical protein DRG30_03560 [Epsilonproteobacteria bacterium]|nr:MAG: hypothetical protein DRG30_03560 [Campylobacterota bacterium]
MRSITLYGTEIKSDIEFDLDFSDDTEVRYELDLSSNPPSHIKESITCGFLLYHAHGRKVYLYSDRIFDGSDAGQPWCYEVKDIVRFYWTGGERSIYYELDEKGDISLLSFWFTHLLLPLYITLENMYDFLHAGAVEVEGKAILFIAPSMGGKSTMTDYFIQQGHTLISDDKVATFIKDDNFMAVGSHPYHRPYREFEDLGYRVEDFATSFKPIHLFYELKGVDGDADITIEEIKGYQKFDTLLPNYLYSFSYLRPFRLKYLSGMLNNTKVFRVEVPWSMKRLGEVYDMICEHGGGH